MAPSIESLQPTASLWVATLVTLVFASLARVVRGVTLSGAVAGAVVCFVLYFAAGRAAFAMLVLVFILTWGATRLGYPRKQRLGTAEKKAGRTASQVLANVGMAAVCAATYRFTRGNAVFLLALTAALAEAAADTVASELGQAFSQSARLITTWEKVPVGTDGGVSILGTLGGVLSAGIVSLAGVLSGFLPWKWLPVAAGGAIVAMLADSFLGAVLERRSLLNNDGVNFLSTLLSALIPCIWVTYFA
jgi:uncharacterized protein (TIGR00297 family)